MQGVSRQDVGRMSVSAREERGEMPYECQWEFGRSDVDLLYMHAVPCDSLKPNEVAMMSFGILTRNRRDCLSGSDA